MMTIMSNVKSYPQNNKNDIDNARFWIKFAVYLAIIICAVGIAMVILCGQCVLNVIPKNYNQDLIKNIFQSGLIIVVVGTLITWIYKTKTCCTVMDGSLCDIYCCGECYAFYCRRCCRTDIEFEEFDNFANKVPFTEVSKDTMSKKKSLLLNDSVVTKQYSTKYKRRRRTITSFQDTKLTSPVPELGVADPATTVTATAINASDKTVDNEEDERDKKVITVLSMF